MGLFNIFNGSDINSGVEDYKKTPNASLLDVRSVEEYAEGHIPGSVNVPLQNIGNASSVVKNKATPIFTYCLSGARSSRAVAMLKQTGYQNVTNIGGISSYRGEVEKQV